MKLWKVASILGGGVLCVVTGGLAAPAVGAALGGMMGLSGAAAASAGLATLGGGSLAAGGLGMAGGAAVVSGVAGTVGAVGAAGIYSHAESTGELKGKKEGYTQASSEYEKKLLKQAEEFLNQKNNLSGNIQEKEKLLDEYEKYISELESNYSTLNQEQLTVLHEMKILKDKLKAYNA